MENKHLKIHGVKLKENGRITLCLGNLSRFICCFLNGNEYRIEDIEQDGKKITLKSTKGLGNLYANCFTEVEIERKEIKNGYLGRDDIQNLDKVCDENGNVYVIIRQDSDEGFTGTGGKYLIDENLKVWEYNSSIPLYLIQKNDSKYMHIQQS